MKRIDYRLFNLQICPRFLSILTIAFVRNDRKSINLSINPSIGNERKRKEREEENKKSRSENRLSGRYHAIYTTPFDLYFICFFFLLSFHRSMSKDHTRKCVSRAAPCLRALYFSPAPSRRRRLTYRRRRGGGGRKSYIMYGEYLAKNLRVKCCRPTPFTTACFAVFHPARWTTSTRPGDGNPV